MNCALGVTGVDGSLLVLVAVLAVGLIVGGTLLLARRRSWVAAAVLLVVVAVGAGTLGASPASAACAAPVAVNSLTITQTSAITTLGPNTASLLITGTVTNDSATEEALVDAIEVRIVGVILAADATAGTCDADDYVIVGPRMTVGVMLAPGATTTFSGATIAFVDEPWNQDACQGATVQLSYTTR